MASDSGIGIHDLSFATTEFVLPHTALAEYNGTEIGKYHIGIGQESMSVPAADEDIVTLGAAAAAPIIERHGSERIRTVVFATESSIDQAKSGGVYVHSLLGLPSAARVVELKQACYGATAGLQFALGLVARDPSQQVLVIASDVSKYELDSPGEATQGAAAVAMLVGADPQLIRFDGPSGLFTADVMDFWRPNYRDAALVDGQESISAYLQAVEGCWKDYAEQGGHSLDEFAAFCYHQPFTKMAYKAHRHLLEYCGHDSDKDAVEQALGQTTAYNRVIGNSYTASVYLGLAALLDQADDLTGRSIGFLSYGSGSVAEFFAGQVVPGYRDRLRTAEHRKAVERRTVLDYAGYRELHERKFPTDGGDYPTPVQSGGQFRLAALRGHKRIYERR
ncbi:MULTISPECIES: hydroxymethylglutaryl-CoA synthase [Streptomyces]|uniref:Hydroxymethylglutaryl-CoA synthase n=1 Tax=Streptomyces venezuelae TaxID=54571 RepID=A0A5P2BIV8_STRVZ|nr:MULTISPECIES: hydroxymethylglutaryl-CoA synthase [Streptomyces]NEA01385.1 hydroxymethylglutaryl-CoA synthase [Streptomyces sp. SID10116]MYY80962.1 hydroxymethylglutaryl-CoA synthase [Streptomyces sp. SID335]MYZ15659.1 hydroxymethylglutaryl-CoA synthase [Streptomyces sp. SID337]NDZ86432.1 hydroxymethylglutaryl-CoA synthase [Streptomyces sp. SID10115]NEB48268.1 hydroxymethylglutaryl-CoA synthase [Streptomyces sp. SID339]